MPGPFSDVDDAVGIAADTGGEKKAEKASDPVAGEKDPEGLMDPIESEQSSPFLSTKCGVEQDSSETDDEVGWPELSPDLLECRPVDSGIEPDDQCQTDDPFEDIEDEPSGHAGFRERLEL